MYQLYISIMEYYQNQQKHKQLYEKLVHYPINKTTLYRPIPQCDTLENNSLMQFPSQTDRFATYTNSDIVYNNLMSLTPNIDMGIYAAHTDEELDNWINTSRAYMQNMTQTYKKKCDEEETHLRNIIKQRTQCAALRMDYIAMLPLDLIRYIKQFLLPEIQIDLYLTSYPNLSEMMSKLTVDRLKSYYRVYVLPRYYYGFCTTPWKRWIFSNSLMPKNIRKSLTTKTEYINEIIKVLHMLHNVIPHTPDIHRYCQTNALKLMKSILYTIKQFSPKPKVKGAATAVKKPSAKKKTLVIPSPAEFQNTFIDQNPIIW